MITIILIRHGETDWNREKIFRGQADVTLNRRGLNQAWLLAKYLAKVPITNIYSSPLKRALKTAEVIANYHHIKVEQTTALTDINYGVWQGMSEHLVREQYGQLFEQWLQSPHLVKIPRGETLDDVRQRGLGLIDHIVKVHDGGTVALVSHRVMNKVLICALLGLDSSHFWNIKLDTCGISTFIYMNEKFILTRHNDTSFLKQMGNLKEDDF